MILVQWILLFHVVTVFTAEIEPPRDMRLVKSVLEWEPPHNVNVLYKLQYKLASEPNDSWQDVLNHKSSLRKLTLTPVFYGALFRVRSEDGNNTSEWIYSKRVQCVNVDSCSPLMNLSVKPGMACLSFSHMDQSLEEEHKGHIEFNISFWKVTNGGPSEMKFEITASKTESLTDLDPGQTYCFQTEYLFYNHPYGNPSNASCVIIPETYEARERQAILTSVCVTLAVLALCGGCVFLLFKHHKRIKRMLKPPVNIPSHFQEFLSGDFSQQEHLHVERSPSLRSCDFIIVIEDHDVEQSDQ